MHHKAELLINLLHYLALGGYLGAVALLAASFVRGDRNLPPAASATLAAALASHAGALVAYGITWGELPLVGLGPSLSTLALLIATGSLFVAIVGGVGPLGLVLLPLVGVLTGIAIWTGVRPSGAPLAFRGAWFALHVVFGFVGYAGLTLAFAAGLMYLLQFRELKSKRFGAVFRFFPPLDTLDRVGQRALLGGFLALSLALVLGWAWTARFQRSLEIRNPQVIWGVLTWIVFAAALAARHRARQGRRAALVSVVGFAVVVASYLVLRVQSSGTGFL